MNTHSREHMHKLRALPRAKKIGVITLRSGVELIVYDKPKLESPYVVLPNGTIIHKTPTSQKIIYDPNDPNIKATERQFASLLKKGVTRN